MSWRSLDPITTVHSGSTIGYIQVSIHLDILILFILLSSIYGSQLDIHSGGEDLRFPHHKNERAGLGRTSAVNSGLIISYIQVSIHLDNLFILLSSIYGYSLWRRS